MNETNYIDIDDLADLSLFVGDAKTAVNLPGKVTSPSATDNEQHYVDILLDAYRQLLAFPPKKSRKSCVGTLEPDQRHVTVPKPSNLIARTAGRAGNGAIHLEPEEWLQFWERGQLAIMNQNEQLDMHQAWSYALGTGKLDLDAYRGYGHLRRLGYIAVCMLLRCAPRLTAASADIAKSAAMAGGYQIYKPNVPYKKRSPGMPQFHMAVSSSLQPFPTAAQLRAITDTRHESSAILGVSELGSIVFLKVKAAAVPNVLW
ncbi:hypothetical protein EV183_002718 [Coemansia sp. RSA 2336]|nr:hypothetical protein EV183_002718 [Coemansia sp. RSA 2336]